MSIGLQNYAATIVKNDVTPERLFKWLSSCLLFTASLHSCNWNDILDDYRLGSSGFAK